MIDDRWGTGTYSTWSDKERKVIKNVWERRTEGDRVVFIKREGTKESLESEGTIRNYLDEKAWPGMCEIKYLHTETVGKGRKMRHEMIYWMEGKKKKRVDFLNEWMNGNGMMRVVIWEFNRFFFWWRYQTWPLYTHIHFFFKFLLYNY